MIKKKVFDSKFVAPLSSHARTRVCFVSEPCFVSFHSGACSKAGGEHGRRSQRRLMAGPLRVVRLFVLVMIVTTVYAGSEASFATHEPHLTAWDPLEAVESFIVSFPEQELSEPDDLDRALDELPVECAVRRLRRTLRGAVLKMRASQARAFQEKHPSVSLERDAVVTAQGFRTFGTQNENDTVRAFSEDPSEVVASSTYTVEQQRALHWGLDRVDQRMLPLDNTVPQDSNAGAGHIVYVVDSGVRSDHVDLQNRVFTEFDSIKKNTYGADDCYGHGTAVASLAAGSKAGLAPGASIVSIRVLDCQGNGLVSDVVSGLETVAEHFAALKMLQSKKNNNFLPTAALTLSLGVPAGRASRSLDAAVRSVVEQHSIAVVAAAGNDVGSERRSDACDFSPGRVASAITVGASDTTDRAWTDGMTGRCVDVFAPGVRVLGASHENPNTFVEWTGTSMAAPIVAGAVLANTRNSKNEILQAATNGVLWDERFSYEQTVTTVYDEMRGDTQWGPERFRGPRPGRVLPGTPNALLFHRG